MHVRVEPERCCGSGQCVLIAPEIFDQRDEDGVVILLKPDPEPRLHEAARRAQQICPALAIWVENDTP